MTRSLLASGLSRTLGRLSHTRRGALTILSGTAAGQVLALISAPILSRLYSPANFGLFTVISSAVTVVGTVAALRFELAVPLPKDERDAQALVALGLGSTVLSLIVTGTLVATMGDRIAARFDEAGLMPWLWALPVISAFMGAYLLLNQLAIRHRRYSAIGRRNVLQSSAMVATQLGAGFLGLKTGGLVVGLGMGQATSAVSLVAGSQLFTAEGREGRTPARLRAMARRYRRFPLILAPSGLLNVMGLQLPVILIAYWYGSSVAGWMGLTQRVLSLPVMLVGTAMAQVYLGELARAAHDEPGRAHRLFVSASRRLFAVGAAAAVAVVALGPFLFGLVFGSEWRTSGQYAQALAVSLAAQLLAVPVSQTLIVFERQLLQLAWDAGRLVLIVSAVAATYFSGGSALHALWAYGVASAVAYSASWGMSYSTIRRNDRPRPAVPS
ncbi:lipopolysaccharide biosynthesis protein [Isoptericola sp. b441]|uniref:Lipopolysaccharide biosynthesis protein n=1 Tax=Actinotalea lenta TaxID=3064654 RepID=A0ABT9DC90_9CELL|nr:lipopolysaccharide biosynthesis protein [Isoptericola sp. b441]MDO8108496.1 lipopolysaccharide biosynthesis protein [Isoptericola sp. b441]